MNLKEQIDELLLTARKENDVQAKAVLSSFKGELENTSKNEPLKEEHIQKLAAKYIKNVESFKPKGWEREVEILQKFLPEQFTDSELKAFVKGIIGSYPTQMLEIKKGNKAMTGFLMGKVMQQIDGRADAKRISSAIVESINEI